MRKFFSFLLAFMLLLSLGISAQAATSAGLIYDETEQLLSEDTQYLGPNAVPVQEEAEPQPGAGAVMETAQPEAVETYARYTPFEGDYLIDSYGLLTEAEQAALEAMAKEVSQRQDCGVYMMVVDDFKQLNGNTDIYKANYTYYHDKSMGIGADRNGILLLLSMEQRDFSFFVYGDKTEYALNKWGQRMLENEFIDDLGDNRWYDGLEDFVQTCDEYMSLAAQGDPVREPPQSKMLLATAISSFIALLASAGLWNKNKGAQKPTGAYAYISGEFVLDEQLSKDTFINTTVTRKIIESSSDDSDDSDSSSVARSGGGGSGRSGKF